MKLNGAAILIECLIEQNVGTVFGFPGGAVLPIYDELYKRQDRIQHVLTAHEQHAGHAADGYARASGKTGVCIATSGPGATNLVTPIATAYMDSSPVVFITGNVPQSLMGTDSFQEADISGMTMPVTKHNYLVTRVEKLADTIREAFYIAGSGRLGPVLIDIPKDVQIAETEYEPGLGDALIPKLSAKHPTAQLRPEGEALERYKVKVEPRLEKAAQLIAEAHKPLIYCGGGVTISGAEDELARLPFAVDELMAVVPAEHPIAALDQLPLSALRGEDILTLSQETLVYDIISNACMRAGFEPHVILGDHNVSHLIDCISLGMGVGLLFDKQLNAASSLDLVRAVPVTPACRTHISLAYLKNEELSENARNFLAMYKETLA